MSVEAGWDAWTSLDPGHYRLFVGDPPREVPRVERFQIPESETPAPSTVNKIDLPAADRAAEASLFRLQHTIARRCGRFDWNTFLHTVRELEKLDFHERANVLHFSRTLL